MAIVPLTASMPQSVLVYWAANNSISMVQATVLKNKRIKKYYGILDPPIPDPNAPAQENPFTAFMGVRTSVLLP